MKIQPIIRSFAFFLSLSISSATNAGSLTPKEALAVGEKVHVHAIAKNFCALESLMAKGFLWSFGGDSSARDAIEAWRTDPAYLKNLGRVTRMRCKYTEEKRVKCPANADKGYRAAFKQLPEGWRMISFVAGD